MCHAQLENIISGALVSEFFVRVLLWLLWGLLTTSPPICLGGWHFLPRHVIFPVA